MQNISVEMRKLLSAQKKEWELAGKNFAGLQTVQVREFVFDGFTIKVQFNPGRIVSSAAKVDKKSIEDRPCFLCEANRPKEQRGINFANYSVLVNPFPIFPEHFTIPTFAHTPQNIHANFNDLLDLAHAMPGFTVIYNGPKCGASAPDHLHFQVGNSGFMPIDTEIDLLKEKFGEIISKNGIELWAVKDGLRNFLVLESDDKNTLAEEFKTVYEIIENNSVTHEEPMLNILASCNENGWRILIFPRALHRPSQYFEEDDKNILLSPASVDMGGVLITPLEKDFNKMTKEDIADIFAQVLLSDVDFDILTEKFKK
jgi:hypothetical protein